MNSTIACPNGPIAFLSSGHASLGVGEGTGYLIRELGRMTDILIIDVFQESREFKMNLSNTGLSGSSLFSAQPHMTASYGTGEWPGLVKGMLAIPRFGEAISRLRRALRDIQPSAVCVADEQALCAAWLAMPPQLPLAYLVTSELRSICPRCAPAWCRVDVALGVSEHSLRYLRSTRYAHKNVCVMGSGIDVDLVLGQVEARSARVPANACMPTPGAMSIMSPLLFPRPLKGHQTGMQAVANLNQMGVATELWLCEPPRRSRRPSGVRMADLAAEMGVQERVRVLRQRQSILPAMARCDVALLLSSTEDRPQRLLEAMALAKPIVATRTDSTSEWVRDGIDGLLVEPDDVEATVEALQKLSDPALRERMGMAGQRRARHEFSPARQANRFLGALDALGQPTLPTMDWLFNTGSL